MWEAVGGIATVLGLLGGIIKLLLDKYFKQADELEKTKKTLADKSIQDLSKIIEQHKVEIHKLREELVLNTKSIAKADKDLQVFSEDLRLYSERSQGRLEALESRMIKLSEELTLLKGLRNAKKNQ